MDKKLYRSRKNKILGGVAGGLGEYFETDPIIVRLIFIFLAISTGVGVLIYLIMWLVVPLENVKSETEKHSTSTENITINGRNVFGLILIFLGLIIIIDNFLPWARFTRLWPIILILFGILLLSGSIKNSD